MQMTWNQLNEMLIKQAKTDRIPLTGQFELTARCNLGCRMCYICRPANDKHAAECERTADEWIDLAKQAREAGMLFLLLTGGEVLLRKDFKHIMAEISSMGFNVEIYTNATLITPEIAKWLRSYPPSVVGVTMYGASPETYGEVCGSPDGYDCAVRGIDLLLAEGITVQIKTTVIKSNYRDFDKLAEFAEKRGHRLGVVNYVSPRREDLSNLPRGERLSPSALAEFEIHMSEYFDNKTCKRQKTSECNITGEENNVKLNTSLHDRCGPFRCSAAKSSFWITWDGRMTPCPLIDNPGTFPFKYGLQNAWEKLQDLCTLIPACDECGQCALKDYCMSCPARLKAEEGFFDRPAQYLCDLAWERKRLTSSMELY